MILKIEIGKLQHFLLLLFNFFFSENFLFLTFVAEERVKTLDQLQHPTCRRDVTTTQKGDVKTAQTMTSR